MKIKNFLFAAALLSLALASGCATGGSGPCAVNCPAINLSASGNGVQVFGEAGLNLAFTITPMFKYTASSPVNWNITGTSCSGSPTSSSNPCGYFTSTTTSTANYQAPSSVPTDSAFAIVATSQSDSSLSGVLDLTIIPVQSFVAPAQLSVGVGLTQQFTATAVPDNAPQTFTWTCTAGGAPCVNFTQDPNMSGLGYYTPVPNEQCGNNCVLITATATVDPTGCSVSKSFPCTNPKTTVVASRVSGTYAFQFSGFDNSFNPIMVAGTFTVAANGSISGVEDVLTSTGPSAQNPIQITGGAYTPTSTDLNNSNNAGALTFLPAGIYPNQYQVVLDAAGDIQMIEVDGNGSGSGIAEPTSAKNGFNPGTNQAYAFGFTGVDLGGNRVGYAGLLPTNGSGTVSGGLIDVNDGGSSSNAICSPSAAPCSVAGTYSYNSANNMGQLTLTSPVVMNFDFFLANGTTANKNGNNPLTIYAISTDPIATNPAVLGTMVFQNAALTYNNAAFNGTSISALTGAGGNVSLTNGTTDGTSGGTGGTGNFSGNFDQNNAGVILTYPNTNAKPPQSAFAYTYVATNSNTGRYIFQMLGNPGATPVLPPIPFVLYASGANRGFLVECNTPSCSNTDTSVITGTMTPQTNAVAGSFANDAMPGTYAVATNSNSLSSIPPLTMNLLLFAPGMGMYDVGGTQYPGPAGNVTGTYTVQFSGTGTIGLTAPGTANYVIYGTTETDFFMIEVDKGISSPILFMAQ